MISSLIEPFKNEIELLKLKKKKKMQFFIHKQSAEKICPLFLLLSESG